MSGLNGVRFALWLVAVMRELAEVLEAKKNCSNWANDQTTLAKILVYSVASIEFLGLFCHLVAIQVNY